jgi:hypothetical protein
LRTWDEQAALYDKGRKTPGPIVTNAPAGSSMHNYGLACDVVPMTPLGPDWDVAHPVWKKIVETGISVGLKAGATFRTFPDYPHFQLTGSFPDSPNPLMREVLTSGGIEAVWKSAGLTEDFPENQNA